MKFLPILALLIASTGANAAQVGSCDGLDSINNLVEMGRSFQQGSIRTAHVDTQGEPACCSAHLLIFVDDKEGLGTTCFAVSQQRGPDGGVGLGFNSLTATKITAAYDPTKGILLNVPYTLYNPDGNAGIPGSTHVRINRAGETPVVTIE